MGKARTIAALLSRGFDTELAQSLVSRGKSLSALKSESDEELLRLGIHRWLIKEIRRGRRPPIPLDTVNRLLYESRRTCCVCRDPKRSVLIHHIEEWSKTRSHEEDNLVVICLPHHDEAHTKKQLSMNLTPEQLRHAKREWLEKVRTEDTAAALHDTSLLSMAVWDFFNHRRLLDIAHEAGISLSSLQEYRRALDLGVIDASGNPDWLSDGENTTFLYKPGLARGANIAYSFYSSLLQKIALKIRWVDLDRAWTVGGIRALVGPATFAYCKGAFYLKSLPKMNTTGSGQMRRGLRRRGKVRLSFVFDAWEATSSSSYYDHLCGRRLLTGLFLVRGLDFHTNLTTIQATCLALGTGFGPERLPLTPYDGYQFDEEDDPESEEEFQDEELYL